MKAFILLIISGVLTAGVFIVGKQAGHAQLSPLLILFWQMSGGALVVCLLSWRNRAFPVWDKNHLRYYFVGGLLGVSLPYLLAFLVLQHLQVGLVGLMTALSPLMTYAIARMLGVERGNPIRLLGLMLGLIGVALLVMPEDSADLHGDGMFMLLAMGIPLTLATSNIYRSRYWPAGSAAMPLVIGMLSVQAAGLFVINLLLGNFSFSLPSSSSVSLLIVTLAVLAGASYVSSFSLLKVGGPVYLSQVGYVITLASLIAGVMFWHEHYDSRDVLSMGLIFSGVLLTTWTGLLQAAASVVRQTLAER